MSEGAIWLGTLALGACLGAMLAGGEGGRRCGCGPRCSFRRPQLFVACSGGANGGSGVAPKPLRHGSLHGSMTQALEQERKDGCPNYSEESTRPPCIWLNGSCWHCGNEAQAVSDLVLIIYKPRRRWFRYRSRWVLEIRTPAASLGELSHEIAGGWCGPSWEFVEVRWPVACGNERTA